MPRNIVVRWVVAMAVGLPVWAQTTSPAVPGAEVPAKEKETASIEGRVVRAADGSPMKKVEITATLNQVDLGLGEAKVKFATTDADGRFLVKDLVPGSYHLEAVRLGFVRQFYGQRSVHGQGTMISVVPGQRVKDIFFRLIPSGVITGKAVDEDGEPIYEARVQVQRWMFMNGKKRLVPVNNASTNDLGEYRVSQLAPGSYFVSITLNKMMWRSNSTRGEGFTPTFYPGVYDSAQAIPVEVKSGEEVSGINVQIVPVQAVKVSGRVNGGGKAGHLYAVLWPKGGQYGMAQRSGSVDEQGIFEFRGVRPGTYVLSAGTDDEDKRLVARQTIEVGDTDIDGVTLVLSEGIEISGRIRFEGNLQDKGPKFQLGLVPGDGGGGCGWAAPKVEDDFSFTMKNCEDGDYRIFLSGLPKDAYLKSATVGGHDVLEDGLHVSGPSKPLEIVVSANGARVEGNIHDSKDRAVPGARVVLIPDGWRGKRREMMKTVSSDQYGHYSIHGVAPGAYTMYAWETVEEGAYQDPDFLKQYVDMGKAVKVTESSQMSMDLKVIAAQEEEGN